MTVLRAWAPLFWSGVLVGLVHTIVDALGADPPAAIVYGSGVLLAASAVPVLIGLVHALVVGRRAGAEDRAGDPRLAPVARLVAGRVRGAVAVLIEPERRTEGAWGTSGTDRSLDPDTRFEIGSVTKTFTATLLAEMVGRGEVALDDRVAEYVPGVPATRAGEEVTLVDLATHSGGMPRLPRDLIPRAILQSPDPYRSFDERRLEAAARRTRPGSGLGETARYSNFGVALLGHALARAAGRDFAHLIAERILHPLDLRETAVATLDETDPRAARGHDQFGFGVPPWNLAAIAPAGGIVSTATDMARWLEAQMRPGSTPLADAIRMTHEPRVPLQPSAIGRLLGSGLQGSRVGLAWITTDVRGREIVWHNGGTGGFGSFIGFGPGSGRGIVVLTNSTHARRLDEVGLALVSDG